MSKGRDRTVYRRNDAGKASSIHDTQKGAINNANTMLGNQDGGELTVMRRNGKIRSKDTIYPGNDPYPPRDTEH